MNRRDVLIGIGVAGVTAATPVAGAAITKAANRNAWNRAFSRYQRTNAEFDRLWSLYEQASEAWERDHPRIDRYFNEDKLGIGMSRERVIDRLRVNHWVKGEAGDEEAIRAHADEFMAYQERHEQTKKLHRVDEWEEQASAYGEAHYFPARTALMAVPAPDTEALLVKMGIAAESGDEDFMASCYADARRLFGRA